MESINNSLKVLLVDDDSTCLAIVAAMLKKLKFQVVSVKNANDAILTLRTRGEFDVVICDVHMPDFNGFQLQHIIFQEFRTPVVLMSGDNHEGIVRQGMQNGAISFIKKPISSNDLRGLWRHITAQKKSKAISAMVQGDASNQDNANLGTGGNSGTCSNLDSVATSKKKMVWTDQLHYKFLDAISSLGSENAVPRNILKAMNVPGLTRENVASHLQKYRQFLRRHIQEIERNNGQPRLGGRRISRLAKLEQLFAQGQLHAALSSPTSSAALGGSNSGGHASSRQGVHLSEDDESMFYRGLSRDPVFANLNAYSPASHEGNYSSNDNTNVSGFGTVNVVSGNENVQVGQGSFQMNEQGGYVLPQNYNPFPDLLNFDCSAQDGGQQFSASPYFENYNYGGLGTFYDNNNNSGGNKIINLTNNFYHQVNINQPAYPHNQMHDNSSWYMPGTSNFNQQLNGNEDDDFMNSLYGSNPYGGAGNGEGM